jgi:hypothetical protein
MLREEIYSFLQIYSGYVRTQSLAQISTKYTSRGGVEVLPITYAELVKLLSVLAYGS